MRVETSELMAAIDIAKMLGVQQSAVSNWGDRAVGFPAPVVTVANGRTRLWLRSDVLKWYRGRIGGDHERTLAHARALVEALEGDNHDRG